MIASDQPSAASKRMAAVICVLLALAVFAVFGQTLRHGFVNFDDNEYVYANARVIRGLSWENVVWAFTHVHSNNWHPLTTLSHMLDCQLFGLNPAGHHAVNVLLHAANAILLFLALQALVQVGAQAGQSEGARGGSFHLSRSFRHGSESGGGSPGTCVWRSAFVAAVFAIHPLRAESVAWISERKDLLSGLFFMLTLWAYARYVGNAECRMQNAEREGKAGSGSFFILRSAFSLPSYWLVVLFFTLGLMAKPMLVTIPLVLLLLDYWPLRRFGDNGLILGVPRFAILEKLPFILLALVSCVVTIFAQRGALQSLVSIALPLRLSNAFVACATYMGQLFWPVNLAAFYPFMNVSPRAVILSIVLLVAVTTVVVRLRANHSCLLTGWSWYLVMLVPVIGIVQVGAQARADRYTYLPLIGLALALTWFLADLGGQRRGIRILMAGLAMPAFIALALMAHHQVSYWKDSGSLWLHALGCTRDNPSVHYLLANDLLERGRFDEAIGQYQEALRLRPDYAEAHNNLGNALLQKGRVDEAMDQYRQALQWEPGYEKAHHNWGNALLQEGRFDESIDHYQQALRLKPDYAEAHANLGNAFVQKGRVDEAIDQYRQALRWEPGYERAYYNWGNALLQKGRFDEAIDQYQQALRLKPDFAEAHNNLGNALLQKGRSGEAIDQYQEALRLKPDYAEAHNNLGNAFLQEGRLDEAISQYQQALRSKPDLPDVHCNLGNAFIRKGRFDEAIDHYQEALRLRPDFAEAHNILGNAFVQKGQFNEAIEHYRHALQIDSNHAAACINLGLAWAMTGKTEEALSQYRKALRLQPNHVGLLNTLARELATTSKASLRNGVEAVKYAVHANELAGQRDPELLDTLAAAYAEAGRFSEAVSTARQALELAEEQSNSALAEALKREITLYESGNPLRISP